MKYSTTRVCSRVNSFPTTSLSTGVLKNEEHSLTMSKRGEHIYKHIIKGWTTDPNANDVFVRGLYANPRKSEKKSEKKENSLCSSLLNDKVVARYRYKLIYTFSLFVLLFSCYFVFFILKKFILVFFFSLFQ